MTTTETTNGHDADLRILRERARKFAVASTDGGEHAEALEVVQFRLGRCTYAIEAKYVFSSRWLSELTPVPGSPSSFLGITPLQGEVLPVIALDVLFETQAAGVRDLSRIVVVGRTRPEVGFAAGRKIKVAWLEEDRILQAPETGVGATGRAVAGVTEQGLILLDGSALLEDERLFSGNPPAPNAPRGHRNAGE